MARATNAVASRKRRKKVLKQAKGYYGHKSTGFRTAKEQVRKSMEYQFRDRKNRKRDFRKLWITRINAAVRQFDLSYSQLMYGLKLANVELNRKMLSEIAILDIKQFESIVNIAKKALADNKQNS
ncbi:MAG: 50S ribosomal protein L20 [Mycoplasmataceae bacterium]|nr:50S ribosomal protein L20 [Mycoplasmataceae bacterium]